MTDDKTQPGGDRQIDIELQRTYMQQMLREAQAAIIVILDDEGQPSSAFMNMNMIERRGMIELMHDTAPRFYPIEEDDDEDGD